MILLSRANFVVGSAYGGEAVREKRTRSGARETAWERKKPSVAIRELNPKEVKMKKHIFTVDKTIIA